LKDFRLRKLFLGWRQARAAFHWGIVADPVFALSNSTIIHAHCVAATQMLGPGTAASRITSPISWRMAGVRR